MKKMYYYAKEAFEAAKEMYSESEIEKSSTVADDCELCGDFAIERLSACCMGETSCYCAGDDVFAYWCEDWMAEENGDTI